MEQALDETCYLAGVAHNAIGDYWRFVAPLLEQALEYGQGEYTLDEIHRMLLDRDMQLWIGHRQSEIVYAAVTELVYFPSGKKFCYIVLMGGSDMSSWLEEHMGQLELWALSQDVDTIRVMGRPGFARTHKKLGFESVYSVLDKPLRSFNEDTH